MSQHQIACLASIVFPLALAAAAWSDWRSFTIPNRLVLTLLVSFIPAALLESFTISAWLDHAGAALALFGAGAALFSLGLWGGGDAKLLPATALWLGWGALPRFLLIMSLTGFLLALVALAVRAVPAGRAKMFTAGQIPYGVAIAAAGFDWWLTVIQSAMRA